ncbi:hypothetical protein ACRAWD_18955 [Caulobacter segnis]
MNAAFAQLANVERGALLGHAWIGLIHPDDVAEILVRREAARRGPIPTPSASAVPAAARGLALDAG